MNTIPKLLRDIELGENKPAELKKHPFEEALTTLINKHSMESESNTPDFILAQYILTCLSAYKNAVNARDKWFEFIPFGASNPM
jgi:hypothetical protein